FRWSSDSDFFSSTCSVLGRGWSPAVGFHFVWPGTPPVGDFVSGASSKLMSSSGPLWFSNQAYPDSTTGNQLMWPRVTPVRKSLTHSSMQVRLWKPLGTSAVAACVHFGSPSGTPVFFGKPPQTHASEGS